MTTRDESTTVAPCYDVIAWGDFSSTTTDVHFDPTPRPTTAELEQVIDREWHARLAEAARSGRVLYNGDLFRYVSHRVDQSTPQHGHRLSLTVGPTCYRDFVGTNFFNPHRVAEFGWSRFSNAIGTTATLVTTDGRIVYGRRSDRVAYHAGYVHTFGGTLEAADRMPDGRIDPFASVCREIVEEVGIQQHEMSAPVCVAIVRDRHIVQPEMLFEVSIALTADEIMRRWPNAEAMDEHSELLALLDTTDAIDAFMRDCGPIAPVATAALELRKRRLSLNAGPVSAATH